MDDFRDEEDDDRGSSSSDDEWVWESLRNHLELNDLVEWVHEHRRGNKLNTIDATAREQPVESSLEPSARGVPSLTSICAEVAFIHGKTWMGTVAMSVVLAACGLRELEPR
jgi:hypothetical protein